MSLPDKDIIEVVSVDNPASKTSRQLEHMHKLLHNLQDQIAAIGSIVQSEKLKPLSLPSTPLHDESKMSDTVPFSPQQPVSRSSNELKNEPTPVVSLFDENDDLPVIKK